MAKVTAREWRWVAVASVVVLGLFSIPYIVGWMNSTPQARFSGFVFAMEDMYSYLAKMRYGARDGWQLQLVYTSEPHTGGLVYLPILALGKLTALISGQGASVSAEALIVSFHTARLVCGALLLGQMYVFIAHFLDDPSHRRLAWAVAAAGGGLGWLEAMLGSPSMGYHLPPVEFYVPEAFTPLLLFSLPHLALARTLLLAGWLALFRAVGVRSWRWALAAGLAWLGMSLCVPIYAGLLGVTALAWLAALGALARRFPWLEIGLAGIAGFLPALYVAYNVWLFSTNPVFATWSGQNLLPSPPPLEYLIAYGPLAALAIPGVISLVHQGMDRRSALLVVWPVAALALVYLPINVQRRLLEGIVVPLAILAALGAVHLYQAEARARRWARFAAIGLTCMLAPSSLLLVMGEALIASQRQPPVFHTADEILALGWLAEHAPPDSIVLSTHESGMMLPAFAPVRTYVGHGPETVHSVEKTAQAARFFGDGMDDTERVTLLKENAIRYIWIGGEESALACQEQRCFDPQRLGLAEEFRSGAYSILQVRP